MRKTATALLVALLIAQTVSADKTAEEIFDNFGKAEISFSDMDGFEWAHDAVSALAREGVVTGSGDGSFRPSDTVSRIEFIKMAVGACAVLDSSATCRYSDVLQDNWGYIYAASAKKCGMLELYPDDILGAGEAITREDMAYIAAKALEFIGCDFKESDASFSDEGEIAPYAHDAVLSLYSEGVISGFSDGTFRPKGTATRAEAAKIIYNTMQKAAQIYIEED